MLQDAEVNDLARFPWFFKRYPGRCRASSCRATSRRRDGAVAVLAGTAAAARTELDLPHLSRLLHLSAGVVRTTVRPDGQPFLFRAAGSAGGRFPLELYVAVPEGLALPAGVHWYDGHGHALVQVGPPPRGGRPLWSSPASRGEPAGAIARRGYRHVYWDAGTMLSQLLASADSAGIVASLPPASRTEQQRSLVGADGVHGGPWRSSPSAPGTPPSTQAVRPPRARWTRRLSSSRSSRAAQRAGEQDALEPP